MGTIRLRELHPTRQFGHHMPTGYTYNGKRLALDYLHASMSIATLLVAWMAIMLPIVTWCSLSIKEGVCCEEWHCHVLDARLLYMIFLAGHFLFCLQLFAVQLYLLFVRSHYCMWAIPR